MLIYRGPLERSRLRFASKVMAANGDRGQMAWLVPKPNSRAVAAATSFEPALGRSIRLLDGRYTRTVPVRRLLSQATGHSCVVHVMGLSAAPFVPSTARTTVWWLNGVPEERFEYHPTRRNRVKARLDWAVLAAKLRHRRAVLVVVSAPMRELYASRLPDARVIVAPCTVDRRLFGMDLSAQSSAPDGPIVCGYAGSGAPWQQIPQMARIWHELARTAPDRYAFRVVTRDPRVHDAFELAAPGLSYERLTAEQPEDVARHMAGCAAGFVLRDLSTTNLCAYPTKVGEYLASGLHVVTSDIGGDPGELIRRHGAGVLVDPQAATVDQAAMIDRHLRFGHPEPSTALSAAGELDEETWVTEIAGQLDVIG